jgi:intracellular sulfur oxidation DsrE/DsrF family protein
MTENTQEQNTQEQSTHRRGFLGILASGAAALGLTALATPLQLNAQEGKKPTPAPAPLKPGAAGTPVPASPLRPKSPADQWFDKLGGTHRVVYDATQPHEIFPFAWPAVFLMTNASTGSPANDCGVIVVLRHNAIGYALKDAMWEKYHLSDLFKANDHGPAFQAADGQAASKKRNIFLAPSPGDFKVPGIGALNIGIRDLMGQGVMFCVCNAAMTVFSAVAASQANVKPEEVMKEWTDNVISGIQVVPSGVWALGRAQEHKCAYIFAG